MHPFFKSLRSAFVAGLITLLPLGVTILVLNFLIQKIGTPASELFFGFVDDQLRTFVVFDVLLKLVSTLIVVVLITALGLASRYFLGKIAIQITENVCGRLPLVNTIYTTVKQIVHTFSEQNRAVLQQVVLVTFPEKGSYAIGFLTGKCQGEVQDKTEDTLYNVFVPTTPNPTSGFLLVAPERNMVYLKMSVGDAMKLIISGGAITPDQLPQENIG